MPDKNEDVCEVRLLFVVDGGMDGSAKSRVGDVVSTQRVLRECSVRESVRSGQHDAAL